MSAERDLQRIAETIRAFERRVVPTTSGPKLPSTEQGRFRGLVIEAKAVLETELGQLNDFSSQLTVLSAVIGLRGPEAAIREACELIEGGIRQMNREARPTAMSGPTPLKPLYVDRSRIAELVSIRSKSFDLSKLVQLCKELNIAAQHESNMSVAMIVRTIINHVPPIFGHQTFAQVAANYGGGGKSFKASMKHLADGLRNIADAHLHMPIRASESLPTPQQVSFHQDLDVLLAEIVRILRGQSN